MKGTIIGFRQYTSKRSGEMRVEICFAPTQNDPGWTGQQIKSMSGSATSVEGLLKAGAKFQCDTNTINWRLYFDNLSIIG